MTSFFTIRKLVRISAAFFILVLFGTLAHANDIVVCKVSDATSPVPAGTSFSFTIDGTTQFSLTVGGDCMEFHDIGAGDHIISEAAHAGTVVSQITVDPPERLVTSNLALGTVTATAVDDPTPTTVTFYNATQAVPLTQGCTPGYWKQTQHFHSWVGFAPTDTVGTYFTGALPALSGETLLAALQGGGGPGLLGAETILLRAAVAALLNSSSVAYPYTQAQIVNAVNAALATGDRAAILTLATTLDNANNGVGGCPLS